MDEQTIIERLRAVPALRHLDDQAMAAVVHAGVSMEAHRGAAVIEQEEAPPGLVILVMGAATAMRWRTANDGGKPDWAMPRLLRGPAVLLDPAVLDGGGACATWRLQLRSALHVVPLDVLPRLRLKHATLETALLAVAASELRAWAEALDAMTFGGVEGRLERLLTRLADELGVPSGDGRHIHLPLDRGQLARMVQTTPETVSRIMCQWQREDRARMQADGIWWRTTARLKSTPPPAAYEEQEGPATARAG